VELANTSIIVSDVVVLAVEAVRLIEGDLGAAFGSGNDVLADERAINEVHEVAVEAFSAGK
jgi:hypothetical protein